MKSYINLNRESGFTLIELLVVIAIIGLLSSMAVYALNVARMKARDAKKLADFRSISNALQMFYDKNGQMPPNYVSGQEVCDGGPNQAQYDQVMGYLVSEGFLAFIPRTPGHGTYCYYNYGKGNNIGGLLVTILEAAPSTTTGIPPSCRPWPAGVNWCSQSSSKQYCLCNPF
ncbi:MAG: type II secretion system protein [Patescibacteria group bacterium]|nr:type II secretion system protein [Patescibacteria group bacterium]